MNFVFISDFFVEHVQGGAEFCDDALIRQLQKNNNVIKVRSNECTQEFLDSVFDYKIVVSNFVGLSECIKKYLIDKRKYIIYEHDHKYLKNRNPSGFDDYKAPQSYIINEDFYNHANAVVAQSSLHGEVVQKNLPKANVVVSHFSLWNEEQLDYLEKLNDIRNLKTENKKIIEENGWSIMDSKIDHKNTIGAVKYCEKNNLNYSFAFGHWKQFTELLSLHIGFVFFPKTLETMSRVCVESRMLGLKIKSNNSIGATSEDWFKLKGKELIDLHREAPQKVENLIIAQLDLEKKVLEFSSDEEDITVVLTLYKRPQNLKEQIEAIRNQTVKPKEIWLWINEEDSLYHFDPHVVEYFDDKLRTLEGIGVDRYFCNNHNWKFYGRFAVALLADTKYLAFFDDDTIPGKRWFENCLRSMKDKPGIYGTVGYFLNNRLSSSQISDRVGWPKPNESIEEVDFVGHAWFCKYECLSYLWREKPQTWDNGEDITLSYMCQKYGGIKTYVPPHPVQNKDLWGSTKGYDLGVDDVATSNNKLVSHNVFFNQRDQLIKYCKENGWKLIGD